MGKFSQLREVFYLMQDHGSYRRNFLIVRYMEMVQNNVQEYGGMILTYIELR